MTASIIQICGLAKKLAQASRMPRMPTARPWPCSVDGAPGGSTRRCHRPNRPMAPAASDTTTIQHCTQLKPMRLCSQPVSDTSRPDATTAPRFQHMPCSPA